MEPTDGWQKIDTAPKDGTEIDLWIVADSYSLGERAYRKTDVKWFSRFGCFMFYNGRDYVPVEIGATHWKIDGPPHVQHGD